jgi:Leucine-rich repeat (LRR) protein
MDKKYLEKLSLSWSEDEKDLHFTNSQSEMDILGKLQPTKTLKRLDVHRYRGTKFPEWVGNSSYHNLTELYLIDCWNCCILPPLGQLSSLKKLTMRRMSMLETIGYEYGDTFSGTFFPSLECLEFKDMPSWKMWHHSHESEGSYPVLKSLEILDCPKLEGNLPSHLPNLGSIKIQRCNQLGSSLPKAFSIRKLHIFESNKVALHELPLSLEELRIQGSEVTESVFKAIAITPPTSLQILDIRDCSSAISIPGDCLLTSLKFLYITDCKNLNFPKQNHQLESLQYLTITRSCDSLTTLPLDILPNLINLHIYKSENIECLSTQKILPNLNYIGISNCPRFVSFLEEGLSAPSLKILYITNCTNLKSLPCHINTLLPKLEVITLDGCPEMEAIPDGSMSRSLRSLCIGNCEKLLRNPSLTLFDMLSHLSISDLFDGVDYFPRKDFALLPPSLTCLELWKMSSLHTLECTGLLHLTSLQQLTIGECPKLENVAGERMPASLINLQVFRCPLLKERFRMKHPKIWPKISHIKVIQVDYKWI